MTKVLDFVKKEKLSLLFVIASVAVCLSWSLYTRQVWEDFFITYKYSRNLVEGNGLVYMPGEKVHGFTSPLGVLLPAVCGLISGPRNYDAAIWLFRILFCIPAFTAGCILLMKCFKEEGKSFPIPAVFAGVLYLFESKSVAYSMNGMETSFILFFLAWTIYMYRYGFCRYWLPVGIAWAGLMWTRPDSFLYIGGLALAGFIFRESGALKYIISTVKSAIVTTVLYLPWFIWAWVYYGSPVPNTVMAKGAMSMGQDLMTMLWKPIYYFRALMAAVFAPSYFSPPTWPPYVFWFCFALGTLVFIYWTFFFVKDKFGRMLSLVFFLMSFYLLSIPVCYPWYLPPVALIGIFVSVSATSTLTRRFIADKTTRKQLSIFLLSFIAISFAMIFGMMTYMEKIRQTVIEDGTRKQIGLWLNANTAKTDRIYLECLGYIGYFADRKMLDYPGLATPEVTKVVKEYKRNFHEVPEKLKPEWIVLRYFEAERFARYKYFKDCYEPVVEFNSLGFSDLYGYIPGENNIYFDAWFIVFKRK
ncbi:MAG: hypothetical protein A2020_07165 [Lentisphaerae bacterium GWF2_45_14]|nr:MAG: hypothetical protein A2020_07165 [Lentisphaerae bacterium GWF2_45_14]